MNYNKRPLRPKSMAMKNACTKLRSDGEGDEGEQAPMYAISWGQVKAVFHTPGLVLPMIPFMLWPKSGPMEVAR